MSTKEITTLSRDSQVIGGYLGTRSKLTLKSNKSSLPGNRCNIDDRHDGFERSV